MRLRAGITPGNISTLIAATSVLGEEIKHSLFNQSVGGGANVPVRNAASVFVDPIQITGAILMVLIWCFLGLLYWSLSERRKERDQEKKREEESSGSLRTFDGLETILDMGREHMRVIKSENN
eukprot:694358-Ditylum_brightwellii.AAC.1